MRLAELLRLTKRKWCEIMHEVSGDDKPNITRLVNAGVTARNLISLPAFDIAAVGVLR